MVALSHLSSFACLYSLSSVTFMQEMLTVTSYRGSGPRAQGDRG